MLIKCKNKRKKKNRKNNKSVFVVVQVSAKELKAFYDLHASNA
jgi:hypothetical protein